jgi:ribose transport system substrate-binding protein
VIVVSLDGIVTEPCAWRIAVDFKQMGKDEILYVEDKLPTAATYSKSAALPVQPR